MVGLVSVQVLGADGTATDTVAGGERLHLRLEFDGPPVEAPQVAVGLSEGGISPFAVCSMAEHGTAPARVDGRWTCTLHVDHLPLRAGTVEVWAGVLGADTLTELMAYRRIATLRVTGDIGAGRRAATEIGPVVLPHRFEVR